jgi:hypothetical protein
MKLNFFCIPEQKVKLEQLVGEMFQNNMRFGFPERFCCRIFPGTIVNGSWEWPVRHWNL